MSTPTEILAALTSSEIIPDILPSHLKDGWTPSVLFTVIWEHGVSETILGNEILRSKVLEEPDVKIMPLNMPMTVGDVKYTLVMADPDAPSRAEPKFRQWRHWVVTGLQLPNAQPTSTEPACALKTKPATTPYWPPGPPPGSGLHRYTFLLFEEAEGGVVIPQGAVEYGTKLEERRSWNAIEFAHRYGLKLVGANFFLCQPEA